MFGEKQTKDLSKQILQRMGGDAGEVFIMINDSYLTRFATNYIHQNVAERDLNITVRVVMGKRAGMAATNRLDADALDEVVARAKASAMASPEDPNFPGLAKPSEYKPVRAFDEATAACSPKERAEAVSKVCQMAKEKKLNASGAFSTGTFETAYANTEDVFGYQVGTDADFSTVIMETDGDASGWAKRSGWKMDELPVADLGAEAVRKTEMGKEPRNIEPGEYPMVADHYVTNDLITSLNFYGMGAQAVQEGRSWMNNRIGEKVFGFDLNIWDDGLDASGMPLPFDFEGIPKQRVDIIKDGVVIGPVYDMTTAAKEGKSSTGHGLPARFRFYGTVATNLFMSPGDSTVDEMIASTERGLYITRFWYTRLVHPSDCVVTGMTRDGVYMIEDGKITFPVKNLRFTQSYVEALSGVETIGKETHTLLNVYGRITVRVPALKLKSFNFTGSTV
jgi:predicted Zn-dependent protease